jgi:hypothetical protein
MNNTKNYNIYIIHNANNVKKIVLVHKETDIYTLLESKKISYSSIELVTNDCMVDSQGYVGDEEMILITYKGIRHPLRWNMFCSIN